MPFIFIIIPYQLGTGGNKVYPMKDYKTHNIKLYGITE